jgi:hypothetical protein
MFKLKSCFLVFSIGCSFLSLKGAASTLPKVKRAFYSVPISPELAEFASFELAQVKFSETTEGLSLFYNLPPEVIGPEANGITLDSIDAADGSVIRGMKATQDVNDHVVNVANASCSKHPLNVKKFHCIIVYDNLFIDQDKVTAFIFSKYDQSTNRIKRLQVAAAFANEPSGILTVELE